MKTYFGRYFDGKTSKAYAVQVIIEEHTLLITNEEIQVNWLISEITQREYSRQIVALQYGNQFPYEQLEITDKEFIAEWGKLRKETPIKHVFASTKSVLFLLILIVAGLIAGYIWGLPFLSKQIANHIPVEYEVELAKQTLSSITKHHGIDSIKSISLQRFFNQLKFETQYQYTVYYITGDVVNAFALPGGTIVVYDALIKKMSKPEELAALLAHELTHVEKKHGTQHLVRGVTSYVLIRTLLGDMGALSQQLMGAAEQLNALQYSRELESEADLFGMHILEQNRISCSGMVSLFRILEKESRIEVKEWMSSHPDITTRVEQARTYIANHPYEAHTPDSMRIYFNQLTAK